MRWDDFGAGGGVCVTPSSAWGWLLVASPEPLG